MHTRNKLGSNRSIRRPTRGVLAGAAVVALTHCSNDLGERPDEYRAGDGARATNLVASAPVSVPAGQENDPSRFLLVTSWTATYSAHRTRQQSRTEGAFEFTSSMTESGSGTLTLANPLGDTGNWWGIGSYSGRFAGEESKAGRANDGTVITWTRRSTGSGAGQMGDDVDPGGNLSIDVEAGTYDLYFSPPEVAGTFEASCEGLDGEWEEALMDALLRPMLDALCPPKVQGATSRSGMGGGISGLTLPATGLTLSGSTTLWDGTDLTWSVVPEGERPVLRADAGGPYETSRGAEIRLDGSRSTGSIVGYEWTFAAGVDCPADAPFDAGARKAGEAATVVALCSVEATLTVTDGVNTDTDPATLNVHPRIWETEFVGPRTRAQSDAEEQLLEQAMFENVRILATRDSTGQYDIAYRSGINVSAHTGLGDHTFDPPATGKPGSWEGKGYDIEQVNDPGGPFHGALHVGNYRMQLARRTLINRYLLAESDSGLRSLVYRNFFYAENRGRGGQVDDYLEAIRAHEYEHTTRMRDALAQVDPAERIEAVFGTDREELKRIVDGWIGEAEVKVCVASSDPLPGGEPWSGTLWYPTYDDATPWVSGPAAVNRRAPQNVSQLEAACRG